ncbi:hypothetical protein FI667_g8699, partial [Globisporangium splendens]
MTTTPTNQSASAGSAPAHLDARVHAASIAVRTASNGPLQPAQSAAAVVPLLDPQTDDEAAMLDILDMDLEMNIPDVKSSVAWPQSNQYEAALLARDLPTPTASADAHAMKSQTCVTFLHIMKEFSESSCNAKEMVQRVDSLVHQDEQLLKLLPLTQEEEAQATTPRRNRPHAMTTSETEDATKSSNNHALLHPEATKHDRTGMPRSECNSISKNKSSNNSSPHGGGPESDAMDVDVDDFALVLGVDPMLRRITSPRSVDLQRPAGELKPISETQMMDLDDDDDDGAKRAAKRQRENDKEMDAHDELQRWIDLDLDHRMDVFDFTKDHSPPELAPSATHSTSLPAQSSVSPFFKHANSAFLSSYANNYSSSATSKSAMEAAGYLRGYASAASRDMAPKKTFLGSPWHKVTPFDKKSVTAALFGDDDGDDDDDDSNVIDTMARAKLVANASHGAAARGAVAAAAERQRAGETKCDDESNVWGMEDDEYQQDLLSSIDHSVLCDRENRFLQWDLEMEAQQQQQQQQQMSTPPSSSSFGKAFSSASTADRASKYKWMMATSPREKMARSPSNVDIVDDWNSLDFGTFQNRTVSHILSSCLNKRKLHHPYKNQVKLVNFNVSGDATIEPSVPSQHVLGGSLATSLVFGGQEDAIMNGETMGVSSTPLALLANKDGMALGKTANMLKGEKKSKKREERKRLMSLKMQETFADLEGTFTEQDLDFKGVVGAGSLSKMALAKLETMPLPDLSNLPQDLKDLKRKIEATEHKVEGTKHRHRKGGPCPRCQVQNQLRAAKRAYHKRAVAHKKLPQSTGSSSASSMPMLDTEAADMMFSSPPLTPTASPSSVFDGSSPSLSPVSTASSASPVSSAMRTAGAPFLPVVLPASIASSAPAKQTPASTLTFSSTTTLSSSSSAGPSSLMVAVGSSSNAATHALLQHRQQSAAAQLAKTASRSIAASMGNSTLQGGAAANAARSAAAFQAASARRPCGNTFASSSSSATSAASSSSSSPESASPQVQQVTVTSA